MPSGPAQQIDRLVSSALNFGAGDPTPGQSVSSGTGQSSYGGNVGARVYLGTAEIRSAAAVGTLFGGVYQYVFMTFTTQQPARGRFVSWDLAVGETLYQVNGDAKPTAAVPTFIAGVVIQTLVTLNTFAWMQIAGRASCLFDSAITAALAGNPVSAKISAAVASTFDVGAVDTILSPNTVVGAAETLPVLSTISVVQLNNTLTNRRI
jgi:hypothetical protein